MSGSITLAADVEASPVHIFEILSTTEGHRGFWTEDCEVSTDRVRFGFPSTPIDLEVDVTVEPTKVVRMRVTSGFPFWEGSTWEWELGDAMRAETGTGVVFRQLRFRRRLPRGRPWSHRADLGGHHGPACQVRHHGLPTAVHPGRCDLMMLADRHAR